MEGTILCSVVSFACARAFLERSGPPSLACVRSCDLMRRRLAKLLADACNVGNQMKGRSHKLKRFVNGWLGCCFFNRNHQIARERAVNLSRDSSGAKKLGFESSCRTKDLKKSESRSVGSKGTLLGSVHGCRLCNATSV
jgi:hypothetical protein